MTGPSLNPEISHEDALRLGTYSVLGALLAQPPSSELLEQLAAAGGDSDSDALGRAWTLLAAASQKADVAAVRQEHNDVFIGITQGEITPYASWYRNGELMDAALVALRRDLKKLGFQRAEHTRDPEDHLAALCEVMAMLIDERSPEEARFFMTHLAPWAVHCLADLGQVDTPFHAHLGRLGQTFMEVESRRLEGESLEDPVRIVEP